MIRLTQWPARATQTLAVLLCGVLARSATVVPRVEVLEGDGAINNISLRRAKEPVVRVVDQDGHPIPNVTVSFVLPENGPGGTFADGKTVLTVTTDQNGRAVGTGLRPNGSAGQFQIRVTTSLQGQVATASLTQTNAEPASGGGSSKKVLILVLIGGAAAVGAGLALKGKSGGTSTTSPTGVVITPGTPGFGPPK